MRRRRVVGIALAAAAVGLTACGSDKGANVGTVEDQGWTNAVAITGEEDHPFGLATDGTTVVFATGGSQVGENAVRAVTVDGSAPSRIVVAKPLDSIPDGPLAIDGATVYAAVGRSIVSVPLAGGAATEIVSGRPTSITSLAVDATHVWWTTGALNQPDNAEAARAPKAGGPVEVLAGPEIGHGSYTSVVADGKGGGYAASPGGIIRLTPGAAPSVVVSDTAATGAVTRIALDDDHLYGIVAGGKNNLFRVPVTGGAPVELARRAFSARDLVAVPGGVVFYDDKDLSFVPEEGGDFETVSTGPFPEGSIAVAGPVLVFIADFKLWSIPTPSG